MLEHSFSIDDINMTPAARVLICGLMVSLVVSVSTARPGRSTDPDVDLVVAGRSSWYIVVPTKPSVWEQKAAHELQSYVLRMSGCTIGIRPDSLPIPHRALLVGRTRFTTRVVGRIILDSLRPDGYMYSFDGNRAVMCGGVGKGTLYAVYSFLEDQLGCRKYSTKVSFIPRLSTISVKPVRVIRNPAFGYRETLYNGVTDKAFADWHKLISMDDQRNVWGMWVHTMQRLIPPGEFFQTHPEYFALQGGHRLKNGQLCLSQPDVVRLLKERLEVMVARQSLARFWSVSQNDNFNECQCDSCRAMNARYGGSSGTLIHAINDIASSFPSLNISTLAYEYTRTAPAKIKPLPNTNIMFCSIECNRGEAIATDPRSSSFRRDMEDWSRLTSNMIVWDYVVQFRNQLSPFPNLRVLQPNIQYFAKHHVGMMFQQGCGESIGEFSELRTYLIAKLLWDPDMNVSAVMDDFLNGYYGAAGPLIRQYIDMMHDALEQTDKSLGIYGYPYDALHSYLTPELIRQYSLIFDRAEAKVKTQPEILQRVQTARLPLEFAILDISVHDVDPSLSYFDKRGAQWLARTSMQERLARFVDRAKAAGVERLAEDGTSPDEYRQSLEQLMKVSVDGNVAFGRRVQLLTESSEKYPVGGSAALTNGLHGSNDYHCNWLGFEATSMEAVVDLDSAQSIHSVSTGFLQNWYAWIWLPLSVGYSVSLDGISYTSVATVPNQVADTANGAFNRQFESTFAPTRCRFLKVVATSRRTCPEWHIGAGQKAWIFADEIVVR